MNVGGETFYLRKKEIQTLTYVCPFGTRWPQYKIVRITAILLFLDGVVDIPYPLWHPTSQVPHVTSQKQYVPILPSQVMMSFFLPVIIFLVYVSTKYFGTQYIPQHILSVYIRDIIGILDIPCIVSQQAVHIMQYLALVTSSWLMSKCLYKGTMMIV